MPPENSETSAPYQPTLRDMVMLERPLSVKISPNGYKVAVKTRSANWKNNRYEDRCIVHDLQTGARRQVNRFGDVEQIEWLDDGTLALLMVGRGDYDSQVWIFEDLTGEGWPATDHKTGVDWFKPFAGGLLYLASDPKRDENKERLDRFGRFTHFEQEVSSSALYYVDLDLLRGYEAELKARTEEEAKDLVPPVIEVSLLLKEPFSIRSVYPSPAGDALYLNCRQHDDLVYFRETSAFRISLDPRAAVLAHLEQEMQKSSSTKNGAEQADGGDDEQDEKEKDLSYLGELAQLALPRAAYVAAISPDGQQLLIGYQERDDKMYTRRDLWLIEVNKALQAGSPQEFLAGMTSISAALDREVVQMIWTASDPLGAYVNGTRMNLARFAANGHVTQLDLDGRYIHESFHVSSTGAIAFIGANNTTFSEVFVATPPEEGSAWAVRQLTDYGRALDGWEVGTVETIRWPSKDGVEIEGVLRKPPGFDPQRRYPLLFIVHGGPRWFSEDYLITHGDLTYYPAVQFTNKEMLIVKPNYRGSIGRGQDFTDLNVNNLGTGDLWDIESAIDYLAGLGIVDEERIGCMGWSQGGYISAFAGLHSDRFAAVSVGAGISDWYTYHISNDIPDFTIDYLSTSPFRDRAPYIKSAPISNIANARTPTLIQHGSEDRRVPLSNATELYRALKEMGVPVELFIFPGMGHPITRPRENHAVLFQNLAWFSHYLLGEELRLE